MRLKNVLFEDDSKFFIKMIKKNVSSIPLELQSLLKDIHSLLYISDRSTSLCHIFRNANDSANFF